MKKRITLAFASFAVAAICTLGAASQASAFDLLEELLGSDKYYGDTCGCAQKGSGHVQRCGADCGGKALKGHAQRSGDKAHGGHVQHSRGKAGHCGKGHVQRGGCGKGHVQRGGCHRCGKSGCNCGGKGLFGGHVQHGAKKAHGGHIQRGGKGGHVGGHAQRAGCGKCGKSGCHCDRKGGKGAHHGFDLFSMFRCHSKGSKHGDKGYATDAKVGAYHDGRATVPPPVISDEYIPVPGDPDPST